ncbi:S1 family peptidase [Streptomyces sp. Caat 7-52]|uniref:S1 family peptidase n=1 Tax=Streptomyces sp. Caat 7-52 TaxID=2949637 RepID=UPI00203502D5|nr:S1 family peptidase [Streptomyces sp. Caat 7-52]
MPAVSAAPSREADLLAERAEKLAAAHPDDFGAVWLDTDTGEVSIRTATAKGAGLAERLRDELPDGQAAALRLRATDRSLGELERAADDAIDLAAEGAKLKGVFQTGVDAETNRVEISTRTVSPGLVRTLAHRYGADAVTVVHAPKAPELKLLQGSRVDDRSPFWGGAYILGPGGRACSSGLPWQAGDVSMMLTAGHCAPDGGLVQTRAEAMGYVLERERENWDNNGPRRGTERFPNDSEDRGDIALVDIPDEKSSAGKVYGPGNTEGRSIRSEFSRPAQRDDKFCTSGAATGEVCGWRTTLINTNRIVRTPGLSVGVARGINLAVKQGQCARRGDSGGAIYTINSDGSVNAKGILSAGGGGGTDNWGGRLDPCTLVWTDIYKVIDSHLPGHLRTSAVD